MLASTSACRRALSRLAGAPAARARAARPAAPRRTPTRCLSAAAPTTAQLIRQLRDATGAPMMECKKALLAPDVDRDLDKAREWLRRHGSAKASSKVAGRAALEGLVGLCVTDTPAGGGVARASLVRALAETDFASRSETFSEFVQEVADAAAASDDDAADVPAFLATATNNDGILLNDRLQEAILAIRENLQVESVVTLSATKPRSVLAGYVHGRASPGATCGSSAALVELAPVAAGDAGGGDADADADDGEARGAAREAARRLAMHVVAARPLYLDPASVPADVVRKEKEILMEKMEVGKKPPKIVEMILKGQLRKFYEGACLTEQPHMVEEGHPKVSTVLAELGLEARAFGLLGMSKA